MLFWLLCRCIYCNDHCRSSIHRYTCKCVLYSFRRYHRSSLPDVSLRRCPCQALHQQRCGLSHSGRCMQRAVQGAQKKIKRRYTLRFLSVIIASAILCYGGINAAVALIAIYPIAIGIFQRAGIPKRFIMGAICGGAFTFALSGPARRSRPTLWQW